MIPGQNENNSHTLVDALLDRISLLLGYSSLGAMRPNTISKRLVGSTILGSLVLVDLSGLSERSKDCQDGEDPIQ
jgi:hypothetical protein